MSTLKARDTRGSQVGKAGHGRWISKFICSHPTSQPRVTQPQQFQTHHPLATKTSKLADRQMRRDQSNADESAPIPSKNHHRHVCHAGNAWSIRIRKDILLTNNFRIPTLHSGYQISENDPRLLVRPVMQHSLEVINTRT